MKKLKFKIKNYAGGKYSSWLSFLGTVSLWTIFLLLIPFAAWADGIDSLRVIDEVVVAERMLYHETIHPQVLSSEALQRVNAQSVADALRLMGGVQLKDYGGIGGLKTVNLRSMGSHHVGIYYDGIELGNAQNGVIDLGQFSLDNVEEVSLYNGNRSAIFQTASDFANAGSIYIRTVRPSFQESKTRIKTQYGSCETFRLSALHTRPLTDAVSLSLNAEGLTSSGRYPFTYRRRNLDGTIAYDTTATRHNGDIQALRAEANVYGKLDHGHWMTKLYTYNSNRGIPGAIVNNVWRRGERQQDHNHFVQASWQKEHHQVFALRVQAKYAYYHTHYINNDITQLLVDNNYRQQEAYLTVTNAVEMPSVWSASVSYDLRWNHLDADVVNFAHPSRWSHLLSGAVALDLHPFQLKASTVWNYMTDDVELGPKTEPISRLTPALFMNYDFGQSSQIYAFFKQSFRMPTFNDLYYTQIGNASLRPEQVTQYCLGTRLQHKSATTKHSLRFEAYHNQVKDKIVAYPKGQQFRWTMLNLGRVQIDGLEVCGEGQWLLTNHLRLSGLLQYTWQSARDVTDPNTSYYRDQIPYTPRHSGSATCMVDYRSWSLTYNFVYTGERYCQQENIRYNHLQPWYTSDGQLSWHNRHHKLTIEVNNLFDQQYEVIINYPMPGQNYNMTWQYEF